MSDLITIQEVISLYPEKFGNIQKRGKNTFCKCPFHQDDTASMSINFAENIFHCFSCGEKGDAIALKALVEGVNKNKVKKELLKAKGIIKNTRKNVLYDINKSFKQFTSLFLTHTELGLKALEYLHKRGITDEQIEKFKIGYVDGSDAFKKVLEELGFKDMDVFDSNLLNKSGLPFFMNRVVIPVHNVDGDVVTFVGRDIGDNICKYLNGNETKVYKKSNNLFNIERQKGDTVYLVEGAFDVMAFDAIGLWAVASLGTALTKDQVKLLKKVGVKKVIVAYDGDKAGAKATFNVKRLLDEASMESEFLYLPDKLDPNELLNAGRLEKIANRKISFSDWYLCIWSTEDKIDDAVAKRSFRLVEGVNDLNNVLNFWSKRLDIPRTEVYEFYKKEKSFTNQRLENIILSYALEKPKYLDMTLSFAPLSKRLEEKALKIKDMSSNEKKEALEKTKSLRLLCFEDAMSLLIKQSY